MQNFGHLFSTEVANYSENKKRNRFKAILPCKQQNMYMYICTCTHVHIHIHVHVHVYVYLCSTAITVAFFFFLDDNNLINLLPISSRGDCSHSYINASYIDVSLI